MKREQREQQLRRNVILGVCTVAAVIILAIIVIWGLKHKKKVDPKYIPPQTQTAEMNGEGAEEPQTQQPEPEPEPAVYSAHKTETTGKLPKSAVSKHGILIDVESGEIIATRKGRARISPASMTKILTVLVAAEHVTEEQMEETVPITIDITDYCYVNDCSNVGFDVDEQVPVRDLFYGTILPSGADAALALATYVAGSQEAFVELMNEKIAELGLSETTHVTNCVGLYDEDHYSTVYDMAMILKAASDNEWCRKVLSEHVYTTSGTTPHPDGITVSNWFLRRIEDKDTHGEVLCAKTGYVSQSGSCAASLAADESGREYLCVTAGSTSSWRCIYDHVDIYQKYLQAEHPEQAEVTDQENN